MSRAILRSNGHLAPCLLASASRNTSVESLSCHGSPDLLEILSERDMLTT